MNNKRKIEEEFEEVKLSFTEYGTIIDTFCKNENLSDFIELSDYKISYDGENYKEFIVKSEEKNELKIKEEFDEVKPSLTEYGAIVNTFCENQITVKENTSENTNIIYGNENLSDFLELNDYKISCEEQNYKEFAVKSEENNESKIKEEFDEVKASFTENGTIVDTFCKNEIAVIEKTSEDIIYGNDILSEFLELTNYKMSYDGQSYKEFTAKSEENNESEIKEEFNEVKPSFTKSDTIIDSFYNNEIKEKPEDNDIIDGNEILSDFLELNDFKMSYDAQSYKDFAVKSEGNNESKIKEEFNEVKPSFTENGTIVDAFCKNEIAVKEKAEDDIIYEHEDFNDFIEFTGYKILCEEQNYKEFPVKSEENNEPKIEEKFDEVKPSFTENGTTVDTFNKNEIIAKDETPQDLIYENENLSDFLELRDYKISCDGQNYKEFTVKSEENNEPKIKEEKPSFTENGTTVDTFNKNGIIAKGEPPQDIIIYGNENLSDFLELTDYKISYDGQNYKEFTVKSEENNEPKIKEEFKEEKPSFTENGTTVDTFNKNGIIAKDEPPQDIVIYGNENLSDFLELTDYKISYDGENYKVEFTVKSDEKEINQLLYVDGDKSQNIFQSTEEHNETNENNNEVNVDNYKGNINNDDGENLFKCHLCDFKYKQKESINKHIQDKHKATQDKKYKCPKCKYRSNYPSDMRKHYVTHDTMPYECNICSMRFKQSDQLQNHRLTHVEQKGFQCAFSNFVKYQQHKSIKGNDKNKNCSSNIQIKEQSIESNKTYKCSQCAYQTKDEAHLKCHMGDTVYHCPSCKYETNYKCKLKQHTAIHNMNATGIIKTRGRAGERMYKCGQCKRESEKRSNIERHIYNKHKITKDKNFKCIHCEYETNYISALKRHLLKHDNVRPYKCELCNIRFKRNDHLKRHSVMHSEGKTFNK